MRWDFLNFGKPKPRARRDRAAKRHRTVGVRCELGTVLDLSDSGMRLEVAGDCPVRVGDVISFTIREIAHRVTLRGCVVWVRKGRNTPSTCGIAFLDVRPGDRATIEQIAGVGAALNKSGGSKPASTPAAASASNGAKPSASQAAAASGPASGAGSATPGTSGASGSTEGASVSAWIEVEDLYRIIGVKPAATPEEVHRAFRALARNLHPDHNPSPDAAARFAEVSKAYRVLRDPDLRARYDAMRGRAA
jgi:hypothetical protein